MKLFDGPIIEVYSELPQYVVQLFIIFRGLSHALELIFTQPHRHIKEKLESIPLHCALG